MTIWISQEVPLFNFERLDILCEWIGHPSEKLWPFEFLESFHCSILSVSIYYPSESDIRVKISDQLNFSRASVVSIYYVVESDIRVKSYDHFNFSRASFVQFRVSRYIMRHNRKLEWKVMTIRISRELPLFNFERLAMLWAWIKHPSVSIYYVPELDIRVKSCDHLNFSIGSVVQFRASRYIMRLNWASESKVMTIWTSREISLFNFERLEIYTAELDIRVKSYDHLNVWRAFIVQFRASRHII